MNAVNLWRVFYKGEMFSVSFKLNKPRLSESKLLLCCTNNTSAYTASVYLLCVPLQKRRVQRITPIRSILAPFITLKFRQNLPMFFFSHLATFSCRFFCIFLSGLASCQLLISKRFYHMWIDLSNKLKLFCRNKTLQNQSSLFVVYKEIKKEITLVK